MVLGDFGFVTIVLGATTVGLLLGILIKKFITRVSRVQSGAVCLNKDCANHRRKTNMAGADGDHDTLELDRIESTSDELELEGLPNLKASLGLTEFAELSSVEPYYPKGREEIFSKQRKKALEESCMKFENTIYLLIAIILFFHLIAEKTEEEQTTWQIFVASLTNTWYLILECGRICMQKLANLTDLDVY